MALPGSFQNNAALVCAVVSWVKPAVAQADWILTGRVLSAALPPWHSVWSKAAAYAAEVMAGGPATVALAACIWVLVIPVSAVPPQVGNISGLAAGGT